jgi:hypothetical protein
VDSQYLLQQAKSQRGLVAIVTAGAVFFRHISSDIRIRVDMRVDAFSG